MDGETLWEADSCYKVYTVLYAVYMPWPVRYHWPGKEWGSVSDKWSLRCPRKIQVSRRAGDWKTHANAVKSSR